MTGSPVRLASMGPSPSCTVSPAWGRCSTVWPWKPTSSSSLHSSGAEARNARTASACRSVSSASIPARSPGRSSRRRIAFAVSSAPSSFFLKAGSYGTNRPGPISAIVSPSDRRAATSMPSIEVPLIRPIARIGSGDCAIFNKLPIKRRESHFLRDSGGRNDKSRPDNVAAERRPRLHPGIQHACP